MEERVEITLSGDRELWLVSGDDWCIPVFVDPYESAGEPRRKLFLVSPAIALLKDQFDALLGAVKLSILSQAHVSAWWFDQDVFRSCAKKAPGITPKFYYRWNGRLVQPTPSIPQQADVSEDLTPEAEKFLRFIANSTAMFSMTQLRLFWRAFYQYGLEWLINQQMPIDLGWCLIQPLPFRHNWKEIMLAKHPKDSVFFTKGVEECREGIRVSGFEEDLYDTELVALDGKNHFVYWKLELIQQKPWTKAVEAAEKIRRDAKGPAPYARYYIRQIKNRLPAIVDAYRAFIKEVSRPCGDVVEDRASGAQRVVPYIPRGMVTAKAHSPRHTVIMVSTEEKLRGPTIRQSLAESTEEVWSMPNLLLPAPDVRNSGKDVGESSNEQL
jgi:hypothetical protein